MGVGKIAIVFTYTQSSNGCDVTTSVWRGNSPMAPYIAKTKMMHGSTEGLDNLNHPKCPLTKEPSQSKLTIHKVKKMLGTNCKPNQGSRK